MEKEVRLIDANALSEAVNGIGKDIKRPRAVELACLVLIADAPTVDAVEVVHGRWIRKGAWHIECSECKHVLAHIGEAKNYCPNCGAKMRGDSE